MGAVEVEARAGLGTAMRALGTGVGERSRLGAERTSYNDEDRRKGRKERKRYQGREFLEKSDNVQPWKDISHEYNGRIQELFHSRNVRGEEGRSCRGLDAVPRRRP